MNGYSERETRGAAPVLPMAGGGLATFGSLVARPLEFMLPGLLPRDDLTLCAGPSGVGKSMFFCSLMAALSSGRPFLGAAARPPCTSLYFGAEAQADGEVLERLTCAQYAGDRVVSGDTLPGGAPAPKLWLPDMLKGFEKQLSDCRAQLVIFDPITSYLSPDFSPINGQHVRGLLLELQRIARSHGATVLYTLHNRKSRAGDSSDWVAGNKEWWNVPRWCLTFGSHPSEPKQYVLAVGKQSRSAPLPSLLYRISDVDGVGLFTPLGASGLTSRDIGGEMDEASKRDEREEAKAYLKLALADDMQGSNELFEWGDKHGISRGTMRRAKVDLGVTKHGEHVQGKLKWFWVRPEAWPE